jgi:YYY domain-containing protein
MEIIKEIFFWWLCSLAFGLAAWPLVFLCLKKLPDRGLGFTRIFGLLLVGYLFWLGGMAHVWPNVPPAIWAATVLVLAAGVALLRAQWQTPWIWLRDHWKEWLAYELVFLVLFAGIAWIRANNPEAIGTEKPMELAFINAILRSHYFPPNDPWLSGYSISYYYLGYILTAMQAAAASVAGNAAYNLGSATSYALAGLGAYGVLRNLLCLWDPAGEPPSPEEMEAEEKKAPWRRARRAALPLPKYVFLALLAPFALLWLGNLEGSLEVLYSNHVGWENQTGFLWQALDIQDINQPPSEAVTSDPSTWRFWWWWRASRVINDRDLGGAPVEVIDEFPAFSLTLGDLHPHILSMPFMMLGIALALELLLRAGRLIGSQREQWAFFLLASLSWGSLIFLNTWDFPALFGLAMGAALIGGRISGKPFNFLGLTEGKAFVLQSGAFAAAAAVFMLPFLITFSSQAGGLIPNVLFPSHGIQYLVMFGSLLAPLLFWLVWESFRGGFHPDWKTGATLVGMALLVLLLGSLTASYVVLLVPARLQEISSVLHGMDPMEAIGFVLIRRILDPLATLLPAAMAWMVVAWTASLWKRPAAQDEAAERRMGARLFPGLLVLVGCGLVIFPEYLYLRDMFGTRMNTVFKFYFQTWQYWSLAAAFGAIALIMAVRRLADQKARWVNWVSSGILLTLLLFAMGAVYLPLAVATKTNNFQPAGGATLDASAYYDREHPQDAKAVRWLQANYAGEGAVAEAVGGSYSEYARVSTLTGVPSVLGWVPHEGQWRGGYNEVGSREQDLRTLFTTEDWNVAHGLLRQYNIRYVFFGELELRDFGEGGLAKFQQNLSAPYQDPPYYIFLWDGK